MTHVRAWLLRGLIAYLAMLGLFPLWWSLDAREPLVYTRRDAPVRTLDGHDATTVRAGDIVEIRRSFCWRYQPYDVTVKRWLQDGAMIPLPPSTSLHNTPGCYDLWVPYTIPSYARGTYIVHADVNLDGIRDFPPNPFRRLVVPAPTATLHVTGAR